MKADNNWKETRLLAEDLDILLGIPQQTSEDFLKILENLIVHRFIESIGSGDFSGSCQIELPYLGSLVITVDKKNHLSTDFVVRNAFYRKLKDAYAHHESPLIKQCSEILGKELVNKFEEKGD